MDTVLDLFELAQEEAAEEEQQNRGFLRFELTPHKIQ
jgi:hypothetical protein